MPSTKSVFASIIVAIIILVGGAVGLLYLYPSTLHSLNSGPSTSTTTHKTTTTTTTSSTKSQAPPSYKLELAQSGQALLNSNLTSSVPTTEFGGDGLGEGGYAYNYLSGGTTWKLEGDFRPGDAYFNANSSGLTLTDQTCPSPYNGNPMQCGPYWEWNGDKRTGSNGQITGEENASELSSAMTGLPTNAQLFSIYLTLPQYDFNGCEYNVSSTGCSYEGYLPAIDGVWAVDAFQGNNVYSVAVGLAEYCSALSGPFGTCISSTNDLSVGISTAYIINNEYNATLSKNLPVAVSNLPYTPTHKLTIATDFHSYFEVWVDNILEYSTSSSPITSGSTLGLNFYQFDNVDNMTLSTTWSNASAYSSSQISVTGLSNGMSIEATGANGFNANATANSAGVATLDVSNEPLNLTVNVIQNSQVIASYSAVNVGSTLKLVTTTSGS